MEADDLDLSSCHRLVCAIGVSAIRDARKGDEAAAAWLLGDALPWLEAVGFNGVDEADLRRAIDDRTNP